MSLFLNVDASFQKTDDEVQRGGNQGPAADRVFKVVVLDEIAEARHVVPADREHHVERV